MAEQPTGACSETQIQSVVRSIFGELFVAEQSGSNSRQHSSVTSEINERFHLPRNAAPQPKNVLTVFLGLDVGNENHIGVLVIILCHNSP
jgi:hypothetical protein